MKTAWMWDAEHQIQVREIYGLNIDFESMRVALVPWRYWQSVR